MGTGYILIPFFIWPFIVSQKIKYLFDMIVMERRSAPEQEIIKMNDNYSHQGVVFAVPNKHCLIKLEQNSSTSLLSSVIIQIYQWRPASAKQHGHFFNNQICPPLWASGGGFMYIMQFIGIPWRYALLMTIEWRVHPNAVRIVRWRHNDSFWHVCESF